MARGTKKELTSKEIKKQAIHKMLESLISGNGDEAGNHLHDYLQIKTQEIILGEKAKDDDDEDEKDEDGDEKDENEKDENDDCDDDDKKEKVDEQAQSAAFANSGSVMDDKVKGKIKYENGGKKTLKKHGNSAKDLDDDSVGKTKFKSGGKQPARTLEKTPKPEKFNDGRDKELGTTKA